MAVNTELVVMLGKIDTRLTVIEVTTTKLDKAINGNGKQGIVEDHRQLQDMVRKHCARDEHERKEKEKKDQEDKEKKEKISGKTWGVILIVITQAVGLVFLFIRTGGFR